MITRNRNYLPCLAILLLLIINSCALSNNEYIEVRIHTEPTGANIYINNIKYHNTTSAIVDLYPNKDYDILLKKSGYEDVFFTLRKKEYSRDNYLKKNKQKRRCILDKIFVFPLLLRRSSPSYAMRCDGFDRNSHHIILKKRPEGQNRKENLDNPGASDFGNSNGLNRLYNRDKNMPRDRSRFFYYEPNDESPNGYYVNPMVPGYNSDLEGRW